MSGGKGGSTSSTVEIPQYIEDAARRNLARADKISQIGYVPYYGADVAAFTPMQEAAFQSTADVASAFGTPGGSMSQSDIMGGMPAPTTYAGGVRGYSAAPMYEQSLDELGARRPGQRALIDSLFIDPYSGVAGSNVGPLVDYASTAPPGDLGGISVGGDVGGGGGGGGYTSTGTGFDDTLSVSSGVLTTDELRAKLEEERAREAADARARADDIAARAAANGLTIFQQNQLDGNSSANTGSNLPGMDRAETIAAASDPRGVHQIPLDGMYGNTYYNTYTGGFESRPSHATDNDRPAGPGDTGYDQDRYLAALQGGGTGIIYKDDRREVYLDGVLIGNPKSADSADKILARAQAAKEASRTPPPPPQVIGN